MQGWRHPTQLHTQLQDSEVCISLAALLAGYATYHQLGFDPMGSGTGRGKNASISTQALVAISVMLETVALCTASGSGEGMSSVVVVPEGSAVEEFLREMFRWGLA